MRIRTSLSRRPRGAALLVGLIFLLITTMIAVLALGSTVLQERMTGGQRNDSLAQHGAESALRGGELALWAKYVESDGSSYPSGTYASEPVDTKAKVRPFRETKGWFTSGGMEYAKIDLAGLPLVAGTGRLAQPPVFLIESLGTANLAPLESHSDGASSEGTRGIAEYFRITARSTGGDARVVRTTESVYAMGR